MLIFKPKYETNRVESIFQLSLFPISLWNSHRAAINTLDLQLLLSQALNNSIHVLIHVSHLSHRCVDVIFQFLEEFEVLKDGFDARLILDLATGCVKVREISQQLLFLFCQDVEDPVLL